MEHLGVLFNNFQQHLCRNKPPTALIGLIRKKFNEAIRLELTKLHADGSGSEFRMEHHQLKWIPQTLLLDLKDITNNTKVNMPTHQATCTW